MSICPHTGPLAGTVMSKTALQFVSLQYKWKMILSLMIAILLIYKLLKTSVFYFHSQVYENAA